MKKSELTGRHSLVRSLLKMLLIMKLAVLLILFSVFQAKAFNGFGQNISVNLKNTEVRKVLTAIEHGSDYRFLYNYDLKGLKDKLDFKAENVSVTVALENLFAGSNLTYKQVSKNLFAVVSTNPLENIEATITGKITNETGEPLSGVSVLEKGTANGTTTNNNGEYQLTVGDNAVLVISAIGYQGQEVTVSGQTIVDIKLVASVTQMEQVVVVGYGSQRRKDITGAVSVVNSSDFDNRPIVSAAAGLQGQAPGVNVFASSGKPGVGLTVSVRGNTSLNAKNDPLFVVDGVIVENIDYLNPQDIESFSVLKDASSAAIYGASGANGVVLITTKKGTSGKSKISVSAYTGFSNFAKKIPVLNSTQYRELITEMAYTDPNNENTDWQDVAFNTGREQNLQVAFSGGAAGNRYYVSTGYQKQKGVVAPADYDRYSVRANLDNKVKSWLTLGANLSYTRSVFVDVADNAGVARGGTILSALTSPPTLGIYKADGTYSSNVNQGSWENPVAAAFGPDQQSGNNRFTGNVTADFRITPELSFRSNFGGENDNNRWDYFLDPYMTDYGRAQKGLGRASSSQRFVWLWENTLNYTKRFGDHNLAALVGHTMQESDYKSTYDEAREYPNAAVKTLNAASIRVAQTTNQSQWSKRSYLARVNYGFMDKYLLTANVRYDGSSRFPEASRYGWFPSLSAAWRISNEEFMANMPSISDLKLRVGWGKTGNDGIGDYDYYGLFTPTGTGGFQFNNLPKNNLTWEKTAQTNVGIDAAFLQNRIALTLDGYIKKTTDLLVSVQPPPSSGFGAQTYNVGSIENKGIEFGVNALIVDQDLKWRTNGNISFNRNKVTSLGSFTENLAYGGVYERGNAIRVEVGRPLGAFFGYISDGVDPATGMIKYADLDNSGGLSDGDRTFIGFAQPDFIYGLTNTLNFKNFELSAFLQGIHGNELFNASRIELEGLYDSKNQSTSVLNRWKNSGDVTDIPKATKGNTINSQVSSRYVEDGSYLRLKALTLSYNFGSMPFLVNTGISRFNIYVTGQNLFTLTKYKGFDPEVSQNNPNGPAMGIDYGTYPQARSFIFGVTVDF